MGPLVTFWGGEIEKIFSTKNVENILEIEKICVARNFDPQIVDGELFSTENSKKRCFLSLGVLWGYKEVPSNITHVGNTLGVMLLKNNNCCFCCQKLLILSKAEKNLHHKWKLIYETMGRQKFVANLLPEAPPPICC